MSGVIGNQGLNRCQGASGTPWSAWWRAQSGAERTPVFCTSSTWPAHPSSSTTVWYADFKM